MQFAKMDIRAFGLVARVSCKRLVVESTLCRGDEKIEGADVVLHLHGFGSGDVGRCGTERGDGYLYNVDRLDKY